MEPSGVSVAVPRASPRLVAAIESTLQQLLWFHLLGNGPTSSSTTTRYMYLLLSPPTHLPTFSTSVCCGGCGLPRWASSRPSPHWCCFSMSSPGPGDALYSYCTCAGTGTLAVWLLALRVPRFLVALTGRTRSRCWYMYCFSKALTLTHNVVSRGSHGTWLHGDRGCQWSRPVGAWMYLYSYEYLYRRQLQVSSSRSRRPSRSHRPEVSPKVGPGRCSGTGSAQTQQVPAYRPRS